MLRKREGKIEKSGDGLVLLTEFGKAVGSALDTGQLTNAGTGI